MPWSGDISRMGELADRIADLASVPARASKRIAKKLETLIQGEFDAGKDPYGTAWQPLADSTVARGREPPPLTDTHAMRDSLAVRPMRGAGVSITIDHPAAPHQTGWTGKQGTGPARPILPARAMPDDWAEVIEDAVREEVRGTK